MDAVEVLNAGDEPQQATRVIYSIRHAMLIACLSMAGFVSAADRDPAPQPCKDKLQAIAMDPAELTGHAPSGTLVVEYTVDVLGYVADPEIIETSDRRLNQPVLKAVATWRFAPPMQACRNRTTITIRLVDDESA